MSGYTDRIAEIVRAAMRRAENAGPGEVIWLTDEETEAMREVRVIPSTDLAMKYVLVTDKGEMFGPFADADAAVDWGRVVYLVMSWSIRPLVAALPPAIPRPVA